MSERPEDDARDGDAAPEYRGSVPFGGDRAANAFERFFPGPARLDPRVAARLESIARSRGRAQGQRPPAATRWQARPGREGDGAPGLVPTARPALREDVDRLVDAIREQTEVARAALEIAVASRDDARSTAQNARTLAVAGTVIALLTLLATVITVAVAFAR